MGKDNGIEKNTKNNVFLFVVALVVILIIIGMVIAIMLNSPRNKYNKLIDLGQKYLSEMDYDKAIAAFSSAIEIDPMSDNAYIGLAEAHVGKGEYDKALLVLNRGFEITGSNELQAYIGKVSEKVGSVSVPDWEGKTLEEYQSELNGMGISHEISWQPSPLLPDLIIQLPFGYI